jgi:hypothetical protein
MKDDEEGYSTESNKKAVYIKKNKNAYMFFTLENRDRIKDENPGLKNIEILHVCNINNLSCYQKDGKKYLLKKRRDLLNLLGKIRIGLKKKSTI